MIVEACGYARERYIRYTDIRKFGVRVRGHVAFSNHLSLA